MNKQQKYDKTIRNIQNWFTDVLKIDDIAMQTKFIESFCKDSNFKLPISLRRGGVKKKRMIRLKYKFVEKNWSKFVQFVSAYLVLHNEVNNTATPDLTSSGNGLIDSLVNF